METIKKIFDPLPDHLSMFFDCSESYTHHSLCKPPAVLIVATLAVKGNTYDSIVQDIFHYYTGGEESVIFFNTRGRKEQDYKLVLPIRPIISDKKILLPLFVKDYPFTVDKNDLTAWALRCIDDINLMSDQITSSVKFQLTEPVIERIILPKAF